MKVQCDVCHRAEATVLCCADEAALCTACDESVHAANKLASKHQRVPLLNSSPKSPSCDICQERVGYFFCLEDRALLCRQCDVGVHTATPHVSGHQRFLLTGVRVGLQPITTTHNSNGGGSSNMKNSSSSSSICCDVNNVSRSKSKPSSSEVVEVATTATTEEQSEGVGHEWEWSEILVAGSEFEQEGGGFSDFGFSNIYK